jgi:hypothetical protein
MKDSIVGDAWIQQTIAAAPIQPVIDGETGQPNGDILTGPVRLAFANLYDVDPKSKNEDGSGGKYGAQLLFPPGVDFTPLYNAYYEVAGKEFSEYYNAATGQYAGIHSPFRDQAEKIKFGGYTPGCVFMSCTTFFKPPVVDVHKNPIVDAARVYAGCWAIAAINAYAFKDPRKKGVSFGLQSLMIIGDDTKLAGGAADPNKTFHQTGPIVAPSIAPSAVGGMPGNPPPGGTLAQAPIPAAPMGAPAPVPASTAPASPAPSVPAAPGVPTAPVAGAYTMPGQPVADPRGPVPAGFSSWAEYDELMS